MIRNDLMFYESTAVLCFGYNPMAREYLYLKPLRNSDTFTVHLYTGNRKIIFFHKYSNLSTHGFVLWKKNVRMHANVQTMVFTNDGWWVYKILQNYWQLLMQYKLTIQVSFLVHNLYKNNTLELFYILTTF